MKNKVFLFFILAFLILGFVPLINIMAGVKSFKVKHIYNIDFVIAKANSFLYDYGLNLSPGQVIIGKDDWLYLGNDHANTVTAARSGVDASYIRIALSKKRKLDAWGEFFASKGVQDFKVLVGPNKSSIYSEYLPDWFKISENNKVDLLNSVTENKYYIYPRSALLEAKDLDNAHELYYKTDTHWNRLGAWIAFDDFIKKIQKDNPEINYDLRAVLQDPVAIHGNDLSGFLRLTLELKDQQQVVEFLPNTPIKTQCHIFYTREHVECAHNPEIISQPEPLLVTAVGAQNNKKVLWIRDSFGTALSPYMSRVFSNIVQVHYDHLNQEKLVKLVDDFKPDYVFVTIVERSIDGGLPFEYPALDVEQDPLYSFNSEIADLHDLQHADGMFSITGDDPFIVYKLEHELQGEASDSVAVNLVCAGDAQENIDVQLFWKGHEHDDFSEINSVKSAVSQGTAQITLGLNVGWNAQEKIQYLRLDIEPSSFAGCMRFTVEDLLLNKKY